MSAQTGGEEELLAELERRFAAVGVPVASDRIVMIVEAWEVVTAAGYGTQSALRGLYELFPESPRS